MKYPYVSDDEINDLGNFLSSKGLPQEEMDRKAHEMLSALNAEREPKKSFGLLDVLKHTVQNLPERIPFLSSKVIEDKARASERLAKPELYEKYMSDPERMKTPLGLFPNPDKPEYQDDEGSFDYDYWHKEAIRHAMEYDKKLLGGDKLDVARKEGRTTIPAEILSGVLDLPQWAAKVATLPVSLPVDVATGYTKRRAPVVTIDPKTDEVKVDPAVESKFRDALMSVVDPVIEYGSEMTGPVFGRWGKQQVLHWMSPEKRKYVRPIIQPIETFLRSRGGKPNAHVLGEAMKTLRETMKYHGFGPEMAEEYVAAVGHAVQNEDRMVYPEGSPLAGEPMNVLDRVAEVTSQFIKPENLAITAGVVATPGMATTTISTVARKLEERKARKKMYDEVFKTMSEGIDSGKNFEEVTKIEPPSSMVRTKPLGWQRAMNYVKKGLTPQQKVAKVNDIDDFNTLSTLVKRAGGTVEADDTSPVLRNKLKGLTGMVQEGPVWVPVKQLSKTDKADKSFTPLSPKKRGLFKKTPTPSDIVVKAEPTKSVQLAVIKPTLDVADPNVLKLAERRFSELTALTVKTMDKPVDDLVEQYKNEFIAKAEEARLAEEAKKADEEQKAKELKVLAGKVEEKPKEKTRKQLIKEKVAALKSRAKTKVKVAETAEQAANRRLHTERILKVKARLFAAKVEAMKMAGLDEKMATDPRVNDPNKIKISDGLDGIDSILTGTQLAKFTDALEAILRREYDVAKQNRAELEYMQGKFNVANFRGLVPPAMLDDNGVPMPVPELEGDMPMLPLRTMRTTHPIATMLANKFPGFIDFMGLHDTFHDREIAQLKTAYQLKAYMRYTRRNLPSRFRYGAGNRGMEDLITYLSDSDEGRKELRDQFSEEEGIEWSTNSSDNEKILARRVLSLAKLTGKADMTEDKVLGLAREVVAGDRKANDWMFKVTGMHPDLFRKSYVHVMREYAKSGSTAPVGQWIRENKKTNEVLSKITDMSDLNQIIKWGDILEGLKVDSMLTPGPGTPSYTYARDLSIAKAKELGLRRKTNALEALDDYIDQFSRYKYYKDLVPIVMDTYNKVHEMSKKLDPTLQMSKGIDLYFHDFFEMAFGIPITNDSWWHNTNIRASSGLVGRSVNAFAKQWDKRLGHLRIFGEFPRRVTMADLAGLWSSYYVARYLGAPNWKLVLANAVTQGPLAMLSGVRDQFNALIRMTNPNYRKKIMSEIYWPEQGKLWTEGVVKGRITSAMNRYLTPFRMINDFMVANAAANGDAAVGRLRTLLKSNPTLDGVTAQQLKNILFNGPRKLRLEDEKTALSDRESPSLKNAYQFTDKQLKLFRGISVEVLERVSEGRVKEAERMIKNFYVKFSQLSFGKGSQAPMQRGVKGKLMWMFSGYPSGTIQNMVLNMTQNFPNAMKAMLLQFILASILYKMGIVKMKTIGRWLGVGFMPTEAKATGPIVSSSAEILRLVGALNAKAVAGATNITFGLDPEDEKSINTELDRAWKNFTE